MVLTSTEFVANTLNQVRMHGPLGKKGFYRPTRAIDPVDVHGLIPVIFRQKHPKTVPHTSFTVHYAYIPVIPVCVLRVLFGVLAGVLTGV